ncbi:MAG: 50S ribosomal protein L17 [Microgenomates group bacterium]|nr:50S ribosomal protein L17 [Microgenomates group bacterium]
MMRHQSKKIKFKKGQDSNQMIARQLIKNFFINNRLTTTEKKAKAIKPIIEHLVEKTKKRTEANKNYLLRKLADKKLVEHLFNKIGQSLANKSGGYLRLIKLNDRISDGAKMAKIVWSEPIIIEKKEPERTKPKKDKKVEKVAK